MQKLAVFGRPFICQHIIQEENKYKERRTTETYIADAIWAFGHGKSITYRLADVLPPITPLHNIPDESANEIISRIGAGLDKLGAR